MPDPQNELQLEHMNDRWWSFGVLGLFLLVTFIASEFKKHQVRLNEIAASEFAGRFSDHGR
jgi:hypothetical protein